MSPCTECPAKCCKYFALQIDTPRTKEEFENIRWYLAHEAVTVFIERRKWYLELRNKCKYITKNNQCGIYEKRPQVCAEHSASSCEHRYDEFDHSHLFTSLEEFDAYLDRRFRRKRRKTN